MACLLSCTATAMADDVQKVNAAELVKITFNGDRMILHYKDGTMADALSTAMFVLGETRALNYWRTYGGFEMILINKDNRVTCTKGLIDNYVPNAQAAGYKVRYSE